MHDIITTWTYFLFKRNKCSTAQADGILWRLITFTVMNAMLETLSATLQDIKSEERSPWLVRYSSEKTIYSFCSEPWSTKLTLQTKGSQAGRLMAWRGTADFALKRAKQGANDTLMKSEKVITRRSTPPQSRFLFHNRDTIKKKTTECNFRMNAFVTKTSFCTRGMSKIHKCSFPFLLSLHNFFTYFLSHFPIFPYWDYYFLYTKY